MVLLLGLGLSGQLAAEPVPQVQFTVSGFEVEGDNPLSSEETDAVLAPFLGEQEGLAGLEDASRALENAMRERGFSFHRVIVPPQRAAKGVITLKVLAFTVDQIEVQGNRHFDEMNILASVPTLRAGETPNSLEVARSLMLANEHPSKRLAVFLKESDRPGALDARLQARDVRPWQVFTSMSNTGSPETGDHRLSIGAQHANLFNLDHVLTLSYTTSPGHYGDVRQEGVYYRAPLYGQAMSLSGFYTRSNVNQGTVAEFFEVSGSGTFKGLSLAWALLPTGEYSHKFSLGLEDRLFDNRLRFAGVRQTTPVRSRPLALRYTGNWEKTRWRGGFHLEYVRNLTSGPHNDSAAYGAGLDPQWDALHYGAELDYTLPGNWRLRGRFAGQFANQALISGEQFGLGGANSVRGFRERETAGENGERLSLEVTTPPLAHGITPLGFLDLGHRRIMNATALQDASDALGSFGAGLRWQWRDKLNLSMNLAHVFDGSDATEPGRNRLHFNLFYRF